MGKLDGKVAIITGATKGIGRATAQLFAREGAKVIATGRSEDEGAETQRLIQSDGGACYYVRHDVTSEADWQAVVDRAMNEFGRVDIVVNNAAQPLAKKLEETSEAEYDQLYGVNVEGTFLGMKFGFAAMDKAGEGGCVINISSYMGQKGSPGNTAYCATKGAITNMTKAAAMEAADREPPIRVNSLHPGIVDTQMLVDVAGDDPEVRQMIAEIPPLKRLGDPMEIADGILYLASDEAAYITGSELAIDGGIGAE